MRPAIRRDRGAVSPVIATILLVAITVVLAGVLYVMVSGFLGPVGKGPQVMGVSIQKTGDGKNWSLAIVSTPVGLTASEVRLTIIAPGGGPSVSKPFSALTWTVDGALFVGSGTSIAVGDYLLVDAIRYPVRYTVQISDADTILYAAVFG